MAVVKLGARPFVLPSRVAGGTAMAKRFSRGLTRALTFDRIASWEWAVAIVAVFLLARTPVLYLRRRLNPVIGKSPAELWQEDLAITIAFAVLQIAVISLALRRVDTSSLLRQKAALAYCAFAWLSVAWSVEPGVTARHAALLVGTAGVGWYLGTRFSVRQLPALTLGAATVGLVASLIVTAVWPHVRARSGTRAAAHWAGIYLNRNMLALALCVGMLGAVFLAATSRRGRPAFLIGAAVFGVLIVDSGSRTAPLALVAAFAVSGVFLLLRRAFGDRFSPAAGAAALSALVGTVTVIAVANLPTITAWVGRDATLTHRTVIWQLARWFSALSPWRGWGFDALWANRRAVGQAQAATWPLAPGVTRSARMGMWPFSAHNSYYETLVGLGRLGLLLLVAFLATALWRAFRYAWCRRDVVSAWPLAFLVFAVVASWGESLFIPNEAVWALTIAVAVRVTESARIDGT